MTLLQNMIFIKMLYNSDRKMMKMKMKRNGMMKRMKMFRTNLILMIKKNRFYNRNNPVLDKNPVRIIVLHQKHKKIHINRKFQCLQQI